jgi:hypothetical protein
VSITDTSFASPTSTVSVASIPSAWATLRLHLDAERATKAAAIRREIEAQPATVRTAADAQRDIKRYRAQLKVPAVLASKHWTEDVLAKLDAAKAELADLRAGVR